MVEPGGDLFLPTGMIGALAPGRPGPIDLSVGVGAISYGASVDDRAEQAMAAASRKLTLSGRSTAGNWACWKAGQAFSIAPGQPVAPVFPGPAASRSDETGDRA